MEINAEIAEIRPFLSGHEISSLVLSAMDGNPREREGEPQG